MRVAALQMRSTATPSENADQAVALARAAIADGAVYVQTPEVTNLVQRKKALAEPHVTTEEREPTILALRALAADAGVHIHIGSVVVRDGDMWRNRAFLIGPDGEIVARYDKIHMFDVDLPNGERFRESSTYQPGESAVLAEVGDLRLGITICFDVRFPRLYEELALAGATAFAIPAAFADVTGRAHWHTLVRTRAIENGAFVISATQEGTHEDGRTTYGHSMIVDPWGRVLAEAEATPSFIAADLDLSLVDTVRQQVPVLTARRPFAVTRTEAPARRSAS
ncbi:carbon-nitrogen hydrolase family protein [Acuticoccus mangrovi]|uniref:Carbon-nitrogen hydrolase family protein n=1 Tax=Acuticoccus mangrovi TaxID=2796142 RepID=A0A934IKM4_9HYPH|nr:carbon-nitrogen hydrolase family protein [Acuticoccus mangrovi]MBJ3774081.1 carbon-nitrogen hydrolase family protein [Acuticoccus mangrovi]